MTIVNAATIWAETRAVVARHRGVLLTLSGATVFLPNTALRLLAPALTMPRFDPQQPLALPPGFWLVVVLVFMLQVAGLFAIAAISADAREGGGRPLRDTLGDALPALGRFAGALGLFVIAYAVAAIVLGLAFAIIAAIWLAASPAALASAQKGEPPTALAALIMAIVVPLVIWAWARLSPVVGVYLREPLGIVAGIRRAWALSRGRTASLAVLVVALMLASLTLAWVQSTLLAAGMPALGRTLVNVIAAAASAVIFTYAAAGTGVIYRMLSTR